RDAVYFVFFFFQAEDGIRDGHVTGVQTCALPISRCSGARSWCSRRHRSPTSPLAPALQPRPSTRPCAAETGRARPSARGVITLRSEERRVGKEGREGWAGAA